MFGCVIAGRLVQTNLQLIDDSRAIFELPDAESINFMAVFLLGTVPFPEGMGATVHLHWPGRGFQLLGGLSNDKPSAIFRLRGTFSAQSTFNHSSFQSAANPAVVGGDVTAILGMSIEPLVDIQTQLSSLPSALVKSQPALPDAVVLAEKIVKHMFNYLSSFAGSAGASSAMSSDSYVQMGFVKKWYESFLHKIQTVGIGFLDKQE